MHRGVTSAEFTDENYDTRFRLNAQCTSTVRGMDFFQTFVFFVGCNPACFYAMLLMHFEFIAQLLKEAAGSLLHVVISARDVDLSGRCVFSKTSGTIMFHNDTAVCLLR